MNWVDICIFAILAINSLIGFNQGFIASIFSLVGLLISYFIARLYYPIVAQFMLNNQGIYDKTKGFVDKKLYSMLEGKTDVFGITPLLERLNLPKPIIDIISNSPTVDSYTSELTNAALNVISEALTRIFIDIISLIIAFIAVRIIFIIIVKFSNIFSKLPLLKEFNKILGLLFGLIKGIVVVLIILAVFTPFVSISPSGAIAEGVFNSTVGYYLYDNNILLKYLKELVLL